jgi:glycosyltransferase involved in cell wall biosynthesis
MPHADISFLTWIEHRRTREISVRLGFELVEIVTRQRGVRRYAELTLRTMRFLRQRRPKVLVVQSPSIVLAILTVLLRPFFGYVLLFDAHNEAVEPHLHPSAAVRAISRWLVRTAEGTIVTNQPLAERVRDQGGTPLVLTDPIPSAPQVAARPLEGAFNVVLISTFAGDEPFEAVIAAVRLLPSDVHFYVTGNPNRLAAEVRASVPSNMTLTGFLDEQDYWNLLASSDAIMDLTTMPDCLVCGAYEAIAVDKPIILSDNSASIETFRDFAEFTSNNPRSIAGAVARLRTEYTKRIGGMPSSKSNFEARWSEQSALVLAVAQGHKLDRHTP